MTAISRALHYCSPLLLIILLCTPSTGFQGSVTYVAPDECCVQSTTQLTGVWVQGDTTGLEVGDVVDVTGEITDIDGEATIVDGVITKTGEHFLIRPIGMGNSAIGRWTPTPGLELMDFGRGAWSRSGGASNTGLLVTTWGTVESVYYSPVTDSHWFYLDDGFNAVSDFGDRGILVYSDELVQQGQFVSITGVSALEKSRDHVGKILRSVRANSVALVRERPEPHYSFSDEFDSVALDPRWYYVGYPTQISLAEQPGWLTLREPENGRPVIGQLAPGDWDCHICAELYCTGTSWALCEVPFRVALLKRPSYILEEDLVAKCGWNGQSGHIVLPDKIAVSGSGPFHLRLRRRGSVVYASASFDGMAYSPEGSLYLPGDRFLQLGFPEEPAFPQLFWDSGATITYVRFVCVD